MKRATRAAISIALLLTICLTPLTTASAAADMTEAATRASALELLGLSQSASDTDFDLGRTPTRAEALVTLICALGQENEATGGNWSHPFTDVPAWADKYVGYAYAHSLTGGISASEFGTGNATAAMYLTFVLRALGYSNFAWNHPEELAQSVGILPDGVDRKNFRQADVVLVSWAMLAAKLSDGSRTLAEELLEAGAFSAADYEAAQLLVAGEPPLQPGEAIVKSFDALQNAVRDSTVALIRIDSDFTISDELFFERDDDLTIRVTAGTTLTIGARFVPVGCSITNDGTLLVAGTFDRGLCNLTNNGALIVKALAEVGSGMSTTINNGTLTVEADGKLFIERGSDWRNLGTLTNNGYVRISDGGTLINQQGVIINDGTIDLYAYFEGDLSEIDGAGTLNDWRE